MSVLSSLKAKCNINRLYFVHFIHFNGQLLLIAVLFFFFASQGKFTHHIVYFLEMESYFGHTLQMIHTDIKFTVLGGGGESELNLNLESL